MVLIKNCLFIFFRMNRRKGTCFVLFFFLGGLFYLHQNLKISSPELENTLKKSMTQILTSTNTPEPSKILQPPKLSDFQYNISNENFHNLRDDVTIVTAYFNIGSFQKGGLRSQVFTTQLYRNWMKIFNRIDNPVVAYFDDVNDLEYFRDLRQKQNITKAFGWSVVYRNTVTSYMRRCMF